MKLVRELDPMLATSNVNTDEAVDGLWVAALVPVGAGLLSDRLSSSTSFFLSTLEYSLPKRGRSVVAAGLLTLLDCSSPVPLPLRLWVSELPNDDTDMVSDVLEPKRFRLLLESPPLDFVEVGVSAAAGGGGGRRGESNLSSPGSASTQGKQWIRLFTAFFLSFYVL